MAEKKVETKKPVAKKRARTSEEHTPFEKRSDLKKLLLYTIIVPRGQADRICEILRANKSSAQFIKIGEGTANRKIREVLGLDDTKKDIVYSLVREDLVNDIKKELDVYFLASKRNRGVAFTIDLTAFTGVKLYKFFSQTVRG